MDKPLFVFGCRRSGTTLMSNCLNHHKNIGIFPGETHYFQRHLGGYKNIGKRPPLKQSEEDLEKFRQALKHKEIELLKTHRYAQYFINDLWFSDVEGKNIINTKKAYFSAVENLDDGSPKKQFFEHFLKEIARQQKAGVWGEKSPMHVYYVDRLRQWFPNARFIQLIRDPRATACSHVYRAVKQTHPKMPAKLGFFHITYPRLLKRWKKTAEIAHINKNKPNYFIVKFEDLLLEPEKTLKKVCRFLGENFDKNMLNIRVYHSSFKEGKKGFDKSKIETWKEKAPSFINKCTERYCHQGMEVFNYE